MPKHRLRKRQEFLNCYSKGQKLFIRSFVIFCLKREEKELPWRLGMAITRKTGPAVQRNRLRRLIRESFRLMQEKVPSGYDFVVVPKRWLRVDGLKLENILSELSPVLEKLSKKDRGL